MNTRPRVASTVTGAELNVHSGKSLCRKRLIQARVEHARIASLEADALLPRPVWRVALPCGVVDRDQVNHLPRTECHAPERTDPDRVITQLDTCGRVPPCRGATYRLV